MKVRERMHRGLTTVREEEDLGVALQLMLWGGMRHLPVVDGDRLVGMLSDRDVLRRRAEVGWRAAGAVRDAMTREVETIDADAGLEDAAGRMILRRIGCLPVVDEGRLVGILTTTDLVAMLARCEVEPGEPTVGMVMTEDPVVASPDEYLLEAAARMFHRRVRHLPVLDEAGRVTGMLSDRDVRSAIGNPLGHLREELLVADAMTRGATTLHPDAPVSELVDLLVDDRVGAVPVADDDGRLLGMVSYLDVLRASTEWAAHRRADRTTVPEVVRPRPRQR